MQIDTSSEFGARVARRLEQEEVIWLTTVGPDGTPQPSPVWFLWDGERCLIYSQPKAPKLRNIAANPSVALSFNSDASGGDIVIFEATAEVVADGPLASSVPAYVEKYSAGISRLGLSPEQMAAAYSAAIRVTPTRLRGH